MDDLPVAKIVPIAVLLGVIGIGAFSFADQPEQSQNIQETLQTEAPATAQDIEGSSFSALMLFSFGAGDEVYPEEQATYETSIRYNPESSFCQDNPSYSDTVGIWLEGEGTGTDSEAWSSNGFTSTLNCDGSYTEVEIDITAPETIGDYQYKLYTAPYSPTLEYPDFSEKNNFADSIDTLTVEEPITMPNSRVSLSTHQAELGDTVSVSTQSSGDFTQENLEVWINGEYEEIISDFDQEGSQLFTLDEEGEWEFVLDTRYSDGDSLKDEDSATVEVTAFEKATSQINAPSEAVEGETISLDGSASTGEGDLSHSWIVNGEEIGFGEKEEFTVPEDIESLGVELEIQDDEGQIDTSTELISVTTPDDSENGEASDFGDNGAGDFDDQDTGLLASITNTLSNIFGGLL